MKATLRIALLTTIAYFGTQPCPDAQSAPARNRPLIADDTTKMGAADRRVAARLRPIRRGDDVARLLGPPRKSMNLGTPIPLTTEAMESLQHVYTDPGELPQLTVGVDGKQLDLPLEHTHVKAEITGYVARVEVTQTYQNPFAYPIEAVYVFPLPENSAVDDMKIVIGDRVIEAEIKKREEARRTYEQAKANGHTAALLEQERPNIFTQSVANIEPGTDIDVVIRYVQNLTYDSGEYELVFPMVVGPRFVPGNPTGGRSGLGWSKDTDAVPDASRISPPYIGGGLRSGHDISLEVTANAGLPITTWDVPTHETINQPTIDGSLVLRLATHDSIPNRDFVLKYRVDGKQPQATFLSHRPENGDGYFSLILQPPKMDVDELVGQRELIFVVDVSGSMHGVPLAMCQDAMRQALRSMRPVDTFNVITFAGRTGQLFNQSRPANNTNLKAAQEFVGGLRAGGGTMMAQGVQAALSPNGESGRRRYVFFMTDGYVGNEAQIIKGARELVVGLERQGQPAKVFAFGTGSSVNRHLLDGLSKAGRGIAVYATTREDPTLAVNRYFRIIDRSVIEDLAIDWGDAQVSEQFPAQLPDLFASRPLVVHGRFSGRGTTTLTLRGKANGRSLSVPIEIELPRKEKENPVLRTLWARAKVEWLQGDLTYNGHSKQVVESITNVGLKHRIVTAYTSFVAVDRSRTIDGKLRTILQPVEVPEGVNARMAGAPTVRPARKTKASHRAFRSGGSRGRGGRTSAMMRPAAPPVSSPASEEASVATPSARPEQNSDLTVRGALSLNAVRRIIRAGQVDLRRCTGETGVAITVRWFVTADGKVIQARIVSARGASSNLQRCLLKKLATWKFPKPSDGSPARVSFTFRF